MNRFNRRAPKSEAILAALLLSVAVCGHYWSVSHGAFGETKITIPLELKEGVPIEIPFSVSKNGSHYIELRYQHNGAFDVADAIQEIRGTYILSRDREILVEKSLPSGAMIGGDDAVGTILTDFYADRFARYSLGLHVGHIPTALRGLPSTLRIELNPLTYKTLAAVALFSKLAAVGSLLCILIVIYQLYRRE